MNKDGRAGPGFGTAVRTAAQSAARKLSGVPGRLREYLRLRAGHETPLRVLCGCGCGGAAFLLARASLPFCSAPLGIAWLCAAPEHMGWILTGALAGALTGGGLPGFFASLFAAGLRILTRYAVEPPREGEPSAPVFRESPYLRLATAAASAFGMGLYAIFTGGFYFYDLWGAILSMLAAPAAAWLFLPAFAANEEQLSAPDTLFGKLYREAARFSLIAALTFSLRGEGMMGILPVHTAAALFTLFTCRRRGTVRGVLAGALCGAAAGWIYAPLYAVGALCAGLLSGLSVLASSVSLSVVCGVWCFATGKVGEFVTVFPSQLAGVILFCAAAPAADRLFGREEADDDAGTAPGPRERMAELSDAFGKLADSFAGMSRDRQRPTLAELRRICDDVCDGHCPGCRDRALCWDLEYASTMDVICRISSAVHNEGRADPAAVPDYLRRRCRYADEMLEEINRRAEQLARERLEDDRLSVFASDYQALARVLNESLAQSREEMTPDPRRGEEVCRVLDRSGIRYGTVYVTGLRQVRILIDDADLSRCSLPARELRQRLEQACGASLSPPEFVPGHGRAMVELSARRRLSVSFAAARSAPEPDNEFGFCGDTVCRVENRDDYFYAVICDGMGTGSEAAYASGVCGMFLRRMLGARIGVETALSMLNAVLREDAGECSVGVDVLRIDLLTGKAALFKSGAAPTYIRRDGRVFPVESRSAPIGILRELETVRSDFELLPGDVLLMTSDGIDPEGTTVDRESVWLLDLLDGCDVSSPEGPAETARRVIRAARGAGSRDDASAAIITVSAAE